MFQTLADNSIGIQLFFNLVNRKPKVFAILC